MAEAHYNRANRLSDELNQLQAEHIELRRQASKASVVLQGGAQGAVEKELDLQGWVGGGILLNNFLVGPGCGCCPPPPWIHSSFCRLEDFLLQAWIF